MREALNDIEIDERFVFAKHTAKTAGKLALQAFQSLSHLTIEKKGMQDYVSEADRATEHHIREAILRQFPTDSILGEEYGVLSGTSGFTWVIDPIDGTSNFVNGIPAWCVVISCVRDQDNLIGVIYDPNAEEVFVAAKGNGATLNDMPCYVAHSEGLHDGTVGIGSSAKTRPEVAAKFIKDLMDAGGLFFRNASGALTLSYVASGRLIGYMEAHMNCWDCLAGLLLIQEAGGMVRDYDLVTMMTEGGPVITGSSGVFTALNEIAATHL
jgi:myo-inositol-1(or 4)-monophosphatase